MYSRIFCAKELPLEFLQVNILTNTQKGTLRGLHYQEEPHAEDKLVHCIRGSLFDVMVDLRPASPTFGQIYSEVLKLGNALLIPKGFAHGFQTLEDDTHLLYFCSEYYEPKAASGISWCDPELNIPWPLEPTILSEADQNWPTLSTFKMEIT